MIELRSSHQLEIYVIDPSMAIAYAESNKRIPSSSPSSWQRVTHDVCPLQPSNARVACVVPMHSLPTTPLSTSTSAPSCDDNIDQKRKKKIGMDNDNGMICGWYSTHKNDSSPTQLVTHTPSGWHIHSNAEYGIIDRLVYVPHHGLHILGWMMSHRFYPSHNLMNTSIIGATPLNNTSSSSLPSSSSLSKEHYQPEWYGINARPSSPCMSYGLTATRECIYRIGGENYRNCRPFRQICDKFDIATMTWHALPKLTLPRKDCQVVVWRGYIICLGGVSETSISNAGDESRIEVLSLDDAGNGRACDGSGLWQLVKWQLPSVERIIGTHVTDDDQSLIIFTASFRCYYRQDMTTPGTRAWKLLPSIAPDITTLLVAS
jgi:hypothetical protein